MLPLTHFMLYLARYLMAQVGFTVSDGQSGHLLFAADVLLSLALLPGNLNQLLFLPATGFSEGDRLLALFDEALVHPGQLLIARAGPGVGRTPHHVEEAIGHLDVSREELTRDLIEQQFVGDKTKGRQVLCRPGCTRDGFITGSGCRCQARFSGQRGKTDGDGTADDVQVIDHRLNQRIQRAGAVPVKMALTLDETVCPVMECVKVVEPDPARNIATLHAAEEPFIVRRKVMPVMRRPTKRR